MIKSGITQEEIINWGGADLFNQALTLVNSGDLIDVEYDDETLTLSGKIIQADGWMMPVSLTLKEQGRIESHCPCYDNTQIGKVCVHAVALGIAQNILEMEETNKNEEDDDFIEIPAKPSFYIYLSGSLNGVSASIDVYYGDIDFPACSLQSPNTVRLKDPDDPLVRLTRNIEEERAALRIVMAWGFSEGARDQKFYLSNKEKILNFIGAGLPAWRRHGWRVDISEKLSELIDSLQTVVPVVEIHDAINGDFDVKYTFDALGKNVSDLQIQVAINRGYGFVTDENKNIILVDVSAIRIMHEVFRNCGSLNTSENVPDGFFRVRGIHSAFVKSSLDQLDCVDLDDSRAPLWHKKTAIQNRDANAKFESISLGSLETILRPYQKQGVYWMRFLEENNLNGLLADEMGLGKTLQTLTWLSLKREKVGPNLIVCPTSLVRNWEAESKKFTPSLKVLVVYGVNRSKIFEEFDNADVIITSYNLLQRDFDQAYADRKFSVVVLDEAQNIKNRLTKNATTVKQLSCKHRLALTGTPIENSVADVWSIFDFLIPGYLGNYEVFKFDFEQPIAEGTNAAPMALDCLRKKLHPFLMRRVKKTVAKDLPDKITKLSYCPLSDDAQREYLNALQNVQTKASDLVEEKGFSKAKFEILALLTKLRKISSQGKLDAFKEQLISAIEGGHKILVFSQFVQTLQLIHHELTSLKIPFCYLDGSTKNRLDECNKFNRQREIPVFLISLKAGGTGLNLTSADMVIHYDPWWNPAVEDQATDRAHRIGQKKNVYVMKMIASGTIEEKVLELQRRKKAVISATVETSDTAFMEKLTIEDIKELLSANFKF